MQLTENQKSAIGSWEKATAIVAGAGSGKTEVLTQRLLAIMNSKKVALRQILAITFTEKAAAELKRRIAKTLTPKQREELPWASIGTFSAFCLDLLKEYAPLLGFSEQVSVWDEHTARLAVHKQVRRVLLDSLEEKDPNALLLIEVLEFRHAQFLLEDLIGFRWHAEKGWQNPFKTEDKREEALWLATRTLYQKAVYRYTEEKRERQVFDFQDLEMLALCLLTDHSEVLTTVQNRYQQILVDEVQDINDLQRDLLNLLFVPNKNVLCIVGDPKQSIYRFRGANVHGFQSLVGYLLENGGHKVELSENFRSRPGILAFVNQTFASLFQSTIYTPLKAVREEAKGAAVSLIPIVGENLSTREKRRLQEAKQIADVIRYKADTEEKEFGDFALLFQSLIDVRHYTEALNRAGIPYRLHGGSGFLEAQEVIDLLFVLKFMVNPEDRLALVGLCRSPLIGWDDVKITRLATRHPNDLGKNLLRWKENAWLKTLYEKRNAFSGANILEETLHQTGFAPLMHRLDPSGTKLANIEQFLEMVRSLEINEEMSLKELTTYFEELKGRKSPVAAAPAVDLSYNCCQLMTIHAAKGLEFPIVILPDLLRRPPSNTGRTIFPRGEGIGFFLRETPSPFSRYLPTKRTTHLQEKEKEAEKEEKKRLLYVALTRAKEEILLPFHEEAKGVGYWYGWLQTAIDRGTPLPFFRPFVNQDVPVKPSKEKEGFPSLKLPDWDRSPKHLTVTDIKKETGDAPSTKMKRFRKEGLTGTQIGDWVHSVLKNRTASEDLASWVSRSAFNLELKPSKEEEKEVLLLIENFLQSDLAPPTWEGQHELPFKLKVGNKIISGVIDYIYETKKGWILCDFKTDAKPNHQKYQLQMDIYALAFSKALDKPILETHLLFLKSNKAYQEAVTRDRLKQTEDFLIQWTQRD